MLKIAICDDEQTIREYLGQLTKKCTDAQIHLFADGEELLSDKETYDIILLDISLNQDTGRLNGVDTAKKIRETSFAKGSPPDSKEKQFRSLINQSKRQFSQNTGKKHSLPKQTPAEGSGGIRHPLQSKNQPPAEVK